MKVNGLARCNFRNKWAINIISYVIKAVKTITEGPFQLDSIDSHFIDIIRTT